MRNASGKVTLGDVAREAGVSTMTASRALRGAPRCSPETRDRIRAAAERLGYRPDPLMGIHMAQVRRPGARASTGIVLAMITNLPFAQLEHWPHTNRRQWEGASGRAEQLGYLVSNLELGREVTERSFDRLLRARGIPGAIFLPLTPHTRLPIKLDGVAAAAVAWSLEAPDLHRALSHHFECMLLALETLQARGHRKFLYAVSDETNERVRHAWQAAFEITVPPRRRRVFHGNQIASRALVDLCTRFRPDAILTCGHLIPPTGLQPAPLIIQLDREPHSPHPGIDQQHELIGAAAVDLVIGQLHRGERGIPRVPKRTMIPGLWREASD